MTDSWGFAGSEENATDAALLLEVAKRAGELEVFLDSLAPGTEGQSAVYDAHVMASDLQAHCISEARHLSPETYRAWARGQNDRGPGRFFSEIRKAGGR